MSPDWNWKKSIFGHKINIFCSYFMHFPFNYKFNTAHVVNDHWSLVISSLHWIVHGKEFVLLNNSPELQRDMPAWLSLLIVCIHICVLYMRLELEILLIQFISIPWIQNEDDLHPSGHPGPRMSDSLVIQPRLLSSLFWGWGGGVVEEERRGDQMPPRWWAGQQGSGSHLLLVVALGGGGLEVAGNLVMRTIGFCAIVRKK